MENPVVALMQLQLEIVRQSVSLSSKIMNVIVRNQPRMARAITPTPYMPVPPHARGQLRSKKSNRPFVLRIV